MNTGSTARSLLTSDAGVREAYQAASLREKPTDEWQQTRWKLVQVEFDYGSTVMPPTWQVEHVFVNEPDTWEDIEYLTAKGAARAAWTGMARLCRSSRRARLL